MSSVNATWSGSLKDRRIREDLFARLRELAELSHGYFQTAEPVREYDHTIGGEILVSGSLLNEATLSRLQHIQQGDDASLMGFSLRPAGPTQSPRELRDNLYAVERAHLHGIDFRLYDGRRLYDGEDRISFVFAEVENCPDLDGALVMVEDRLQCQAYSSELIRGANWMLTSPSIHLRYYCEEWLDQLLGSVKYFYVPNLSYWRREPMPHWELVSNIFDENVTRYPNREFLAQSAFDYLKDSLARNVEEWKDTAAQVSAFWASVRSKNGEQAS